MNQLGQISMIGLEMKRSALLFIGSILLAGDLSAGEVNLAGQDPSDLWYRGYLQTKNANELIEGGRILDGVNALDEAFLYFKILALDFPDFHGSIVKARLQQVAEQRYLLREEIKDGELTAVQSLEKELEELKDELHRLQERRRNLDRELEKLKGSVFGVRWCL